MLYVYINSQVDLPQVSEESIAIRNRAENHRVEKIIRHKSERAVMTNESGDLIYIDQTVKDLLEKVSHDDVVLTSSLINFSTSFDIAIEFVRLFQKKKARVIAEREYFDSDSPAGQMLLTTAYPILRNFHDSRLQEARKKTKKDDVPNAGVGRKAFSYKDFATFKRLYNDHFVEQTITKTEFADALMISEPTLNRLIREYRNATQQNKL